MDNYKRVWAIESDSFPEEKENTFSIVLKGPNDKLPDFFIGFTLAEWEEIEKTAYKVDQFGEVWVKLCIEEGIRAVNEMTKMIKELPD